MRIRLIVCLLFCAMGIGGCSAPGSVESDSLDPAQDSPNVILVMADDMGWAQTGYYNHPVLKTPNLDAMAQNGLRLDRFYAAT